MIALTPSGRLLDDALVDELAAEPALTLLCGRYEGFDQRVLEHFASDELSIGRYVLAGGELPAMVVCDAVLRKLPGALGHEESALEESFSAALEGAPEYPALHAAGRVPRLARCPRCCSPATTRGSASGGSSRAGRGCRTARSEPRRRPLRSDGARRGARERFRYHRPPPRGRGCAAARIRTGLRPASGPPLAMSTVIDSLERAQLRRVPTFDAGDRLRVHFQVIEGTRRRTQVFEGVVIKRQGHGARETFTVRKQSFGVGVERTFPLHSPKIERIEVAARGDVRRAKLYYLRGRVGKRARVRERRSTGPEESSSASCCTRPQAGRAETVEAVESADAGRDGCDEPRERRAPRPPRLRSRREPAAEAEAAPATAEPERRTGGRQGDRRRRNGVTTTKKSVASSVLELVVIVAAALGLALAIQAFVVKPYRIPSGSMLPTLHINQRVLVNRIGIALLSTRTSATSSCSTRPRTTTLDAEPAPGRERRPARTPPRPASVEHTGVDSETFIKRVVARRGRPDLDSQRPRDPQRGAGEGRLHGAVRRRRILQLSGHDHDSDTAITT